jgi:peptide-methionine (S)-S-oxide reductase
MNDLRIAVFANGCFWCTEAVFTRLKGVTKVTPGYTGGTTPDPTYEEVSTGSTGHAEALKITYDPSLISYDDLLAVFFNTHDPTTLNRQGNDVGTQYRSAIFYGTPEEKEKAEMLIRELNDAHAYDRPVVTEVMPLEPFYEAEDYHRNYYALHPDQPYCQLVIEPKLEKLHERFKSLLV